VAVVAALHERLLALRQGAVVRRHCARAAAVALGLLLSGAFGGVLGSVPREQFLPAANAYLRRGSTDEGFVTAVHLSIDLASGEYTLYSAGHPPAARFDANTGQWRTSTARGIVLGVVPDLASVPDVPDEGVLRRGDAIMLYTDGLVEAPRQTWHSMDTSADGSVNGK